MTQEAADSDFYADVAGLLRIELERNPRQHDLRFKLLEIYALTEQKDEFLELLNVHRGAVGYEVDPHWPQLVDLGRRIAPEHALFRDRSARPTAVAAAPPPTTAPPAQRRFHDNLNPAQLRAEQAEVREAYQALRKDAGFWGQLAAQCREFVGMPPMPAHAPALSDFLRGPQIYIRSDLHRPALARTAVSLIGQALLARAMGRTRLVCAGTEAGEALTLARLATTLGLEINLLTTARERNLRSQEMDEVIDLGVTISALPDALAGPDGQREALARTLADRARAFYVSPIAAGPAPWPIIVRELQSLHGRELRSQLQTLIGGPPQGLIVSAADGMPVIGYLQAFLNLKFVRLFCTETSTAPDQPHIRLSREHAWLNATGRVIYRRISDEVADFAADHCLPRQAHALGTAGGAVLAEAFVQSRLFTPDQALVLVMPAEHTIPAHG